MVSKRAFLILQFGFKNQALCLFTMHTIFTLYSKFLRMHWKNTFVTRTGGLVLTTGINLFILFFVLPNQSLAQEVLTPELVAKLQSVGSSDISPDGKYIAFTVSVPSDPYKENESAKNYLHVYDTETGSVKPYFTRSGVHAVDFRPQNLTITFLASKDGDSKTVLYEIPMDGGEATVVKEFERSISSYAWHPSGEKLFFTAYDKKEISDVDMPYSADIYEENQPLQKGYVEDLSQDGELHKINIEGTLVLAEWSPDGDQLAISVAPSSGVDDYYMFQKVKILDGERFEIKGEVENEGKLGQISWSPDGEKLALKAAADIHDPTDGRIMLVSARGGKPRIIDRNFKGKFEEIKWIEEDKILFLASKGTSSLIGKMNPGTGEKEILFEGKDFSISSIDIAGSETIALVASTPLHPYELFLLENGTVEKVTNHNLWLKDIEFGKQEVIEYNSRDGKFVLEGILIYPVDYVEGRKVPIITLVHGGPESHHLNGWLTSYSMPGQMAAGKGYAVFYPNYRGSTGRGIEFLYSSQGDLAGSEFDDIVDGVDFLIERGIADEDRIGVTGGSYGGYASAWMSTYYSERFAAAVMFVGISNNLSKWGTSDIPEELFLVHARERIWNDWEGYLKRSPVYYVDRAQTPLLIMHGAEDTRVYPGQSLELYRHMKVRKPEVPVRLVWYPGEGHGNRRSTARYDYSLRLLRWFDTYLMTGNKNAPKPDWQAPVQKNTK